MDAGTKRYYLKGCSFTPPGHSTGFDFGGPVVIYTYIVFFLFEGGLYKDNGKEAGNCYILNPKP